MGKKKKKASFTHAQVIELNRDDLREKVTSENMRKTVLAKQNGYHGKQAYFGDELT